MTLIEAKEILTDQERQEIEKWCLEKLLKQQKDERARARLEKTFYTDRLVRRYVNQKIIDQAILKKTKQEQERGSQQPTNDHPGDPGKTTHSDPGFEKYIF